MRDPLVTLRTLWLAIASTVVVLYVVLRLVPHPEHPTAPLFYPVLAGLALALAVASFVVPPLVHRSATLALNLEVREVPGPITPDSPSSGMRRVFADPEQAKLKSFQVFSTSFILSLSLSEAVGLLGFLAGYQGFPLEQVAPFLLGSLVLLAVRFPTLGRVHGMLERSAKASFGAGP